MRRRMQIGAQPHKAAASGDIATFKASVPAAFPSLLVNVNPVQDLHGQANPYPAGGGKNKFNPNSTENEWVTTSNVIEHRNNAKSVRIACSAGDVFTLSNETASTTASAILLAFLGENDTVISRSAVGSGQTYVTATAPQNALVCLASFLKWSDMVNAQLEAGSTATAYAPYENVCPIYGWDAANLARTGTNLFDTVNADFKTGYYLYINDAEQANAKYKYTQRYFPLKPSTQYAISYNKTASDALGCYVNLYDENKQYVSRISVSGMTGTGNVSGAFTTTATTAFARFSLPYRSSDGGETDIQLEEGATATAYEPFGAIFPVQFGQTVYGAQIDWVRRVALCTNELIVLDGTSAWVSNGTYGFYHVLNDKYDVTTTPVFNYLKAISPGGGAGLKYWEGRLNYASAIQRKTLLVKPGSEIDHATKWTEYRTNNPLYALLKLVDPVEIPLSGIIPVSSLKGINNVFADCGGVDLSYWKNL